MEQSQLIARQAARIAELEKLVEEQESKIMDLHEQIEMMWSYDASQS